MTAEIDVRDVQAGHVMAVLPAGKTDPAVLRAVVDRVLFALRDRTEAVLIDAYGMADLTGISLDEHLAAVSPEEHVTGGEIIVARSDAQNAKGWRLHAQRVAEVALRLRAEGHHVVVVGPPLLPGDESLWNDALERCADGALVVGVRYELTTYMAGTVLALEDAAPRGALVVMAYDDPYMPSVTEPLPGHHHDLGVLDRSSGTGQPSRLGAWILAPLALVMGLPRFADGRTRGIGAGPGGPRKPVPSAETATVAEPQPAGVPSGLREDLDAAHRPVDPSQHEVTRAFARAVSSKVGLLAVPLSPRQRAAVLASISVDIRKYCDAASPAFLVPRVSPGALSVARELGVDLCQQVWQDQPAFDPGRVRLHLEHVIPVLTVRTACLRAQSEAAVAEVLRSAEIAWILKSEDAALTRLGYRSRRSDAASAYRHAGIALVACPHN